MLTSTDMSKPTFSTNPSHLNRLPLQPGLPSWIIVLDRTYGIMLIGFFFSFIFHLHFPFDSM